jgi:hypothetical protein
MRRMKCLMGLLAMVLLSALWLRGPAPAGEPPPADKAPAAKAPPGVDPEAVNRAIDRGVAYLKQQQNPEDGAWIYRGEGHTNGTLSVGLTALAGLTLLHCGVAATDPTVQKPARFLRSVWNNTLRDPNWGPNVDTTYERRTYSVALTILFLDRLGEADDAALIRVLASWLLRTQNFYAGSWGYGSTFNPSHRDNSNTQFALLGLWAGSRHGVNVSRPLACSAARFYGTRNKDGGWSYSPEEGNTSSTMAMSCVALMTLALRHAAANEDILRPRAGSASGPQRALSNVAHDAYIVGGFQYLHQYLTSAFAAGDSWKGDTPEIRDNAYYALWSLERVAVAYNLRTIGELDWYAGGARFLLAKQHDDGGWQGAWDLADTCFALLFLRRANLVPEVTRLLKGQAPDAVPALSHSLTASGLRPPSLEETIGRAPAAPAPLSDEEKRRHQDALEGLLGKLQAATGPEQTVLLERWRDGEDARYTPALARAIPTLRGAAERQARAALADRCTRLTAHERDACLRSDDPEIRRAAALACAVRDDRRPVGRLIELLQDKEAFVAAAAHAALCSLTGQDFGPDSEASQADRDRAAKEWKQWWDKHGDK